MSSRASWRLRLGVFLLLGNAPFGYGSLGVAAVGYARSRDVLWLQVGAVAYAVSWVMLLLGLALAGHAGVEQLRNRRRRRALRRWAARRLRRWHRLAVRRAPAAGT